MCVCVGGDEPHASISVDESLNHITVKTQYVICAAGDLITHPPLSLSLSPSLTLSCFLSQAHNYYSSTRLFICTLAHCHSYTHTNNFTTKSIADVLTHACIQTLVYIFAVFLITFAASFLSLCFFLSHFFLLHIHISLTHSVAPCLSLLSDSTANTYVVKNWGFFADYILKCIPFL